MTTDETWLKWEVIAPCTTIIPTLGEAIPKFEYSKIVIAKCMDEQDAKNIVDYSVSYRGLEYRVKDV